MLADGTGYVVAKGEDISWRPAEKPLGSSTALETVFSETSSHSGGDAGEVCIS